MVYVVMRWTASASAYMTVLFPVLAVAVGALSPTGRIPGRAGRR